MHRQCETVKKMATAVVGAASCKSQVGKLLQRKQETVKRKGIQLVKDLIGFAWAGRANKRIGVG